MEISLTSSLTGKPGRSILLFGGKGGVGKTTCSASIAAEMASRGCRTLILTSDMSPSLSDIFKRKIGNSVTAIDRNLDACEIRQETIVAWWKKRFGRDFEDILTHIVDLESLDKDSRHQLLDYIGSAPSLREETMLDMIRELAENGAYDRVIWDTAPAGETLNLLDMPRNIKKHLRAGAKVFEGLDRIGKQLAGKRSISSIMDEWIRTSDTISRFIHEKCAFILVTAPESLVVRQTHRMITTLTGYRLPIHGIIINRMIACSDSKSLDALKAVQATHQEALMQIADGLPVACLPLSVKEIEGIHLLRQIGSQLASGLWL